MADYITNRFKYGNDTFTLNDARISGLGNGLEWPNGVLGIKSDYLATADAMIFKGTLGTAVDGATTTSFPANYHIGDTYKIVTANTYAGYTCEEGDLIIALTDGTSVSTPNPADWTVVQTNIDGAVTGPSTSTDNHLAVFNGANGKVIKDSNILLSDIVLTNDSRLSDARTPTSHTHGIINNNGTVSNTTQGYILAIGDSNGTITTKSIDDYGVAYSSHLHDERYLQKTTYEWNKEIAFGGSNSGKLLIGKFPMYDSNVTITINSTTSTTYHCTAVLATQNINTSGGGSITWHTYDDASNTITPNLYLYYPPDSRNIEIYFSPSSWSKNLIHIQAVALKEAPVENEICSKVFVGTSDNTTATQWEAWLDSHAVVTSGSGRRSPTNMLRTNYAAKSHTHALTNIIGENTDKGKLVIVSNDNNKYLVTSTINDLGIAQTADLPGDATSSTAGLMTAAQYTKLEGIASGAEVNQNAFSTIKIKVGQTSTDLVADTKTDTLTIEAGDNISFEPAANSDTFIITATDTIYTLPHAQDDTLGGIKTGYSSNGTNYAVALDSNNKAYVNVPNKSAYKTIAIKPTAASSAINKSATSAEDTFTIVAGTNVEIDTDTNKQITISTTDTDTTNTAGSTSSTSALYMIGATEQSASPQTYSLANVQMQYNSTRHALDFFIS